MDAPDLDPVVTRIVDAQTAKGTPLVVGISGGVAVGKSTLGASLARMVSEVTDLRVAVVASDGFLHANAVLAERGITDRKGFPESYDNEAITHFLAVVSAGSRAQVPVYDHLTYDIIDDVLIVPPLDVLIFEGVNVLHFHDQLDVGVYLHADESTMRSWFIERTCALRDAARLEYSPFFDPWVDVPDDLFLDMVNGAWESVNLPNLVDHIEPTRGLAQIEIEWEADHSIRTIVFRERP